MPFSGSDYYRVFADLLSGGHEIRVDVAKNGNPTPQSVTLRFDELQGVSPEVVASKYFPAAQRYAERVLLTTDFKNNDIIRLTMQDLERDGISLNATDSEKIKNYVTVANQNIFSDPNVPISLRILADETGLDQIHIRDLIEHGQVQGIRIVANDFVQPTTSFKFRGDPS